jgi:hypothetical protein
VDDATVLSLLARADAAPELPRLGGMARPDGVAIVTDERWAFASVAGGGRVLRVPPAPRLCARVPLLRGLVRLALALTPLFARRGPAGGKEKLLLLAVLLLPLPAALLPHALRPFVLAAAGIGMVAWVLRGRTLFLHGAEHRAIAAAESRSLVAAWHGEARPSRFSPRCGTNFAALVLPVTLLLERAWIAPAALAPVLVPLLALTLTMELWLVLQARTGLLVRLCLAPGLALQRLTTREPSLAETRVALRAVAAVLDGSLPG